MKLQEIKALKIKIYNGDDIIDDTDFVCIQGGIYANWIFIKKEDYLKIKNCIVDEKTSDKTLIEIEERTKIHYLVDILK